MGHREHAVGDKLLTKIDDNAALYFLHCIVYRTDAL